MIWPDKPRQNRTVAHSAHTVESVVPEAVDTVEHSEEPGQWCEGVGEFLVLGTGMAAWVYYWYGVMH